MAEAPHKGWPDQEYQESEGSSAYEATKMCNTSGLHIKKEV